MRPGATSLSPIDRRVLESFKKLLGIGPKPAPPATSGASQDPHARVDQWLLAVYALARTDKRRGADLAMSSAAALALIGASDAERIYAYSALLKHHDGLRQALLDLGSIQSVEFTIVEKLLKALNRQTINWNPADLERLLASRAAVPPGPLCSDPLHTPVIRIAELAVQRGVALTPAARSAIERLKGFYDNRQIPVQNPRLVDRMRLLLAPPGTPPGFDLIAPWAAELAAEVDALDEDQRTAWRSLLALAGAGSGSKPSQKYLQTAAERVAQIGAVAVSARLARWFDTVRAQDPASGPLSKEQNAATITGLVWVTALPELSSLAPAVVELALYAFRKVPTVGAISARVGNACIVALAAAAPLEAVRNLETLRARVRYPSTRALLQRALTGVAERADMDQRELEDLSVPAHGLSAEGDSTIRGGAGGARLTLQSDGSVDLSWTDAKGAIHATVPASLKREAPGDVRRIRHEVKELERTLKTQAVRLEATLLDRRTWSAAAFHQRLLTHPVLASLARRLIWTVSTGSQCRVGMPAADAFLDAYGATLDMTAVDARVSLWHPIDSPAAEVLAWRHSLERRGIVQPFKQAHREIYVLTDAEVATATYSNRFAAHVLKQHQLAALCRERGWAYRLQGAFDSDNAPTRGLPREGDSAEFLLTTAAVDNEQSPAGIFLYVRTDQVRFRRGREPLRLDAVDARTFSEIMRDIDLFVGVCSVGNDPTWHDAGPDAHRAYWNDFAFGDLSAPAQMRREQLERLLPKLSLRDRLSLDGRFLVVRGRLRTYKIHIGSANVLMEPNQQYLCIVPSGRGAERVYLPFDGDSVLPVILSKAVMLAADDQIRDPSIVSQIRRA